MTLTVATNIARGMADVGSQLAQALRELGYKPDPTFTGGGGAWQQRGRGITFGERTATCLTFGERTATCLRRVRASESLEIYSMFLSSPAFHPTPLNKIPPFPPFPLPLRMHTSMRSAIPTAGSP